VQKYRAPGRRKLETLYLMRKSFVFFLWNWLQVNFIAINICVRLVKNEQYLSVRAPYNFASLIWNWIHVRLIEPNICVCPKYGTGFISVL
jgi:hypothetical protein